ncbi:MAG TPA: SDR family oxidoreductase [Candidatus Limnocylindria bacterium]|nr:SDR family oxidoreductase [Candidatus Limnocylindria bacterium]
MSSGHKGAIVITGASTGIGEHCAVALAKRGYRVFAGVRKPADGEALRARAGAALEPLLLDVTSEAQRRDGARTVEQALAGAPLTALWNNAGITVNGPLEFVPLDELRRQLEVNVVGQVAATQAFLPQLRRARGRILITGSVGGFFTTPMLVPYCMSKYAMEAMADGLRRELGRFGIEVSLLEPGGIQSRIWEKGVRESEAFLETAPPQLMELYGPLVNAVRRLAPEMERASHSPDVVLAAVVHALESPRPKTRYRMGHNSRVQRIVSFLPDRWQDALVARMLAG